MRKATVTNSDGECTGKLGQNRCLPVFAKGKQSARIGFPFGKPQESPDLTLTCCFLTLTIQRLWPKLFFKVKVLELHFLSMQLPLKCFCQYMEKIFKFQNVPSQRYCQHCHQDSFYAFTSLQRNWMISR